MKGNFHVRFWSRARAAMPALRQLSVAMLHLLARLGPRSPGTTDPAEKRNGFAVPAQAAGRCQKHVMKSRRRRGPSSRNQRTRVVMDPSFREKPAGPTAPPACVIQLR